MMLGRFVIVDNFFNALRFHFARLEVYGGQFYESKKGDTFCKCRPFVFQLGLLLAAVPCCAAASAGRVAGVEFNAGINFKAVSQKIDLNGLRFFIKFFFHDKLKTIYVEYIIVVFGLIQSHGQGRASSATGIQKDPNRCDLLAIKILLNLFCGFLSDFNHNILILLQVFSLAG